MDTMDFEWHMNNSSYAIRDVPYEIHNGQKMFDLEVALKMEMVIELMLVDRVPHDVSFNKVKDVSFFEAEEK